jgi:predicted pyridoxine 5'-phosphate oxidase superfamily flavin-nucleotide-binding protein
MSNELNKSKDAKYYHDISYDKAPQHEGERMAHQRFGVEGFWEAHDFNAMFPASIPSRMAAFMESLPFFFIATADLRGACDCSFRGREFDQSGHAYALVKVMDAKTLLFPDYSGNNFFNSLGNILLSGQIGMLFICFESQRRVRVNGRASIIEDRQAYAELWPLAQRYVQVTVEQAYDNCQSRIPRMKLVTGYEKES